MAVLLSQNYKENEMGFSNVEGEAFYQAFYLPQSFSLDSIELWFNDCDVFSGNDFGFRCEIRKAFGPDNLLPINNNPSTYTSWVAHSTIGAGIQVFSFAGEIFSGGIYYFSLNPQERTRGLDINLGTHKGKYLLPMLKSRFGNGYYNYSESLYFTINGVFQGESIKKESYAFNEFVQTEIRDESS
jgi:hypothetical protein